MARESEKQALGRETAAQREARLARALRENLWRRKGREPPERARDGARDGKEDA